jgi:AcrR family transcriptional regulator
MRVAALLHATATVFAEKGFDAATMTEIAALAGAPIGSLY